MDNLGPLKRASRWGFVAAIFCACNGSTVNRSLVNGTVGGSDAGQSDGNAEEAASSSGAVCAQVMPTTPAGTCPVMPTNGEICTPPRLPDCGSRGTCVYSTTSDGVAQYCPLVCGDQNHACPPASAVCIPLGSCQTAADCKGDLPEDCRVCPLSPDGVETTACAHWICDAGTCAVGYCENQPNLSCPGGHGCPEYYFPVLDKACTQDMDCIVESHIVGCSWSELVGIATHEKGHFEALESTCDAILDSEFTLCMRPPVQVDESGISPLPGQQIVAVCDAGQCKSVVRGRIECGNSSCPEGQSCCTGADATGLCVYTCAASCPSYSGCRS